MLINYESMWASAKKAKGAKRKTRHCPPEIVQLCGKRLWDWASSIHRLRCRCVYVCMCVVRTHTHVRAYMCRHYGRIVFVLISGGSGECLQHSRRGTQQGVGEMRHRGAVNGWQKTASSKSKSEKDQLVLPACVCVCVHVRLLSFYRCSAALPFISILLQLLNCALAWASLCLPAWLAQWFSAAIFISNWEAINVRVRWQH